MTAPRSTDPKLWAEFFWRPQIWIPYLAGTALITGGFQFRILPASLIVTSQGIVVAFLAVGLASLLLLLLAARIWLMYRPDNQPSHVLQRTCLSFLFASILCLFASIGPNGIGLYAYGRFVRLNILISSFLAFQLAWIFRTESRLWQRFREVWRTKDLVSWQDTALAALGAICLAETATHLDHLYVQVTPFALVLNVALLASVMLFIWALLGRGLFAIVLTAGCYFALSFANAMKLKYLYVGLQPGDHAYLGELLYFKGLFEPQLVAIVAVMFALLAGLLCWAWRSSTRRLPPATRLRMSLGGMATFFGVVSLPWIPGVEPALSPFGIVELNGQSAISCERHGLLFELALHFPDAYLPIPADYDQTAIAKIIHSRTKAEIVAAPGPNRAAEVGQQVSIAVFQFESLMDPRDFGRPLQREVLPHLKRLGSQGMQGYAISPRAVSGSAETEFEVLTGMSSGFLPPNTSTYKHFIKHFIPSLVSQVHQEGYQATAIKCVSPGFYNFQEAYRHLTFDRFCSLGDFAHPTFYEFSGHLSDDAFMDEILRALAHSPAFVVGENLGSHAPFPLQMIEDQPRFLVEPSHPTSDQIEAYLHALARTDQQLGRLAEELEKRPDRVVLLVVGDHHPPLSADSHAYDIPAFHAPGPAGELFRRRVPFVIWKNFDDDSEESVADATHPVAENPTQDNYISMNFLSLLLLREAGIPPQGLIAWNQALFEQCPVVSRDLFYSEGQAKSWDELSPQLQQRIREYELLQYDILLGKNYAAAIWAQNATQAEPNRSSAAEKPVR